MRRSFPLLVVVALAGCETKSKAPSVVTPPEGLIQGGMVPKAPDRPAPEVKTASRTPAPEPSSAVVPAPSRTKVPPSRVVRTTPSPAPVRRLTPFATPVPEIPKADETHRLGYRIPGGAALEVEGVCRFDEASVECWNSEGKPDEALTRRVEAGLDRGPEYGNGLQIRYGMKNRILVVRQTTRTIINGVGDRRSLSLQSVGADPRFGNSGYVQLPEEEPTWDPKVPHVRYEARLFAADKGARQTRARVSMSEPIPNPPELRLARGATVTFNGLTWRVLSIGPAQGHSPAFGMPTGKMWSVRMEVTGRFKRPASVYPQPQRMLYVDDKGLLVDQNAMIEWQRKQSERAQAAFKAGKTYSWEPSPYRPTSFSQSGSSGGPDRSIVEFVTNADPAKLGRVVMGGNFLRFIDVTGIPLDPR